MGPATKWQRPEGVNPSKSSLMQQSRNPPSKPTQKNRAQAETGIAIGMSKPQKSLSMLGSLDDDESHGAEAGSSNNRDDDDGDDEFDEEPVQTSARERKRTANGKVATKRIMNAMHARINNPRAHAEPCFCRKGPIRELSQEERDLHNEMQVSIEAESS
jgi:hypothetical protein